MFGKPILKICKFLVKNRSEIILILLNLNPVQRFIINKIRVLLLTKITFLFFIYKKIEHDQKELKILKYYIHLSQLQKIIKFY